jgi:hypothetical protein
LVFRGIPAARRTIEEASAGYSFRLFAAAGHRFPTTSYRRLAPRLECRNFSHHTAFPPDQGRNERLLFPTARKIRATVRRAWPPDANDQFGFEAMFHGFDWVYEILAGSFLLRRLADGPDDLAAVRVCPPAATKYFLGINPEV